MPKQRVVITNTIICSVLLVLGFLVNTINIDKTYLSVTAPLSYGSRTSNQIGLMLIIDDPQMTDNIPEILDTLQRFDASATFFFTGTAAINNLELLQAIADRYELGNYGFSNRALNSADKNFISEEIRLGDALVNSLVHKNMQVFTPPTGAFNKHTLAMAQNLGYTTVLPTNRDAVIDWNTTDSNLVLSYATYHIKAGDIVALKTTTATMQCFAQVAAAYTAQNLTITSLGHLLQLS